MSKDAAGKKHWTKDFRNDKIAEHMTIASIFSIKNTRVEYPKYTGDIISDTIGQTTFIQFDSSRIYLYPGAENFKNIFVSGLVSPKMIYCILDSSCRVPSGVRAFSVETGLPVNTRRYGWSGYSFSISSFDLLTNVKSNGNQRRFRFPVHFDGFGNAICIFFLELTNEHANLTTDLNTFIQKSKVTLIKQGWVEI
ncbi:hypothetical protein CJD36_012685 [Flavipsychrobacter stenotrophus]|uniref:Uncharacterized protein n=1 Tax=Flavipsychrobacter stenotrophus TaxID=2077091 RepID=A0A2S7SV77_9BACT|nr:hypothetical protein [Flavipsychrobacter stenotrophus]PQJ10820.1 hypothetical protein CJD36_012685 [Flavipsychrobacter stenotrophus]